VTLEQLDGLAARNLGGSACGRHCLSFVSSCQSFRLVFTYANGCGSRLGDPLC
jgi:hypothetical protein